MQTLTKREKTLLYVLLCTLIFIGGIFFLLLPALEKSTTLQDEYSNLELTLMTEKNNIVDTSNIEEDYKAALEELNKVKTKFYTMMKVEDVDKLITGLAITHFMNPTALSISEVSEEEVISYTEYLKQLQTDGSESTETGETETVKKIQVYNVSLNVEGTIKQLQTLINDINKLKTIKLSSVSYTDQQGSDKGMSLTFKIFMFSE